MLVREAWCSSALRSMFDGDGADVAMRIHIENGVLVEIAGFGHRSVSKLEQQGVGICEVANFHGTNPRSKKALWTVSRSDNRITLK